MGARRYAYNAVLPEGGGGWALGLAVENEPGYNLVNGKTFATEAEARTWADGLNRHIGLVPHDIMTIITSTMRGSPRRGLDRW